MDKEVKWLLTKGVDLFFECSDIPFESMPTIVCNSNGQNNMNVTHQLHGIIG